MAPPKFRGYGPYREEFMNEREREHNEQEVVISSFMTMSSSFQTIRLLGRGLASITFGATSCAGLRDLHYQIFALAHLQSRLVLQ